MEESRKRNEASMRRKHNPNGQVNGGSEESGPSPISTGAMDSLLEKLRAAAPQARDQRDRRRRARLKDRHQVRIASGQNAPDLPELKGEIDGGGVSSQDTLDGEPSGKSQATITNGEDVADRAASLLQGLRGAEGGEENEGTGSSSSINNMRVRRRIDSANDERRARRSRRGVSSGGGSSSGGRSGSLDDDPSSSTTTKKRYILGEEGVIPENDGPEGVAEGDESGSGGSNEPTMSNIETGDLPLPPSVINNDAPSTPDGPTTVISPPSPG